MASPDEFRESTLARVIEAGSRLRVKGALNPILWLCAITVPSCILALTFNDKHALLIGVLLCVVVGMALFAFLFLLIFDRDRLHSEEYLLRSRTLDLIEEKGSRKATDAALVNVISQQEFLALPGAEAEEEK